MTRAAAPGAAIWGLPFVATLALGLAAGAVCVALDTPLPWMIGPLVASAIARMRGAALRAPVQAREAGQWVIGTTLGLYFSPEVVRTVLSYAGWIAVGVAFAMALGAGCGALLRRLTGIDRTTAFFAMAIGGASEMATQGERHGARTDRVAAAHSVRIMMVVLILPFAFRFAGIHGVDPYAPAAKVVDPAGLLLLMLLTSAVAIPLRRIGTPNAWVIGPLLMTIFLTANEWNLSALPHWMIAAGQLLIGISLGTRFTPEFLHTAPRYLVGVVACTVVAILTAAGFALLLASLSGLHAATAILATSPGGIAEMSLTARNLHLGVPIVTAFQVVRMVLLVLCIGPLFRTVRRLGARGRG
ncbi:MAG: AbrB family transcriptional regulator [Burkholderiaceae bacterium]